MSRKVVQIRLLGFSGTTVAAILIALKVGGILSISWLWALAPIWLPFACLASFMAALAVGMAAMFLIAYVADRK